MPLNLTLPPHALLLLLPFILTTTTTASPAPSWPTQPPQKAHSTCLTENLSHDHCYILSINDCHLGATGCFDLADTVARIEHTHPFPKVLNQKPCDVSSSHCTTGKTTPQDCNAGENQKLKLCDDLTRRDHVSGAAEENLEQAEDASLVERKIRYPSGDFFHCGKQLCITPSMCCGEVVGCKAPPYGCPDGVSVTGPPSMMNFTREEPEDRDVVCDHQGRCWKKDHAPPGR